MRASRGSTRGAYCASCLPWHAQLGDQANGRFSINIGGCQGNTNLGYDSNFPPAAASLKDFQVYGQVLPDDIIAVRSSFVRTACRSQ